MIVKHTGHMYARNWIGSRCTLPSTREEKRGAIVDPGERRRRRRGGEGGEEEKRRRRGEEDREGLDTEFWFRIPGHRAEFRVLSRSFFRPICLVDTDSQSTTIPCSLFASIGRMRFYRVSYFRRRHTPDRGSGRGSVRGSSAKSIPDKNLCAIAKPFASLLQIDFSLPFQRWMERRVCISSTHRVQECPRNLYGGSFFFFFK